MRSAENSSFQNVNLNYYLKYRKEEREHSRAAIGK